MSLIHCSPLFHPLEPLPIMNPQIMRRHVKKDSSKASNSGGSTLSSPSSGIRSKATSKLKGKQVATANPSPHPLSAAILPSQPHQHHDTDKSNPTSHPLIEPSHITSFSIPSTQLLSPHISQYHEHPSRIASFEQNSFDADSQAKSSLTFTVEPLVPSDLSSSQQTIDQFSQAHS